MKRRTDGPVEERIVPDGVPDYKKRLSKAEKLIWEKEYSIWKKKIPAIPSMRKFFMNLDELTSEDVVAIMSFMDEEEENIDRTKGYRAYFPVAKLSVKRPPQGRLIDDVAEKVLRIVGQGTGFLRIKNQDILLVTMDESDEYMKGIRHQQRNQQLGHLDVVDTIKGIPEAAKLFASVFVALGMRSEPSFYGDMSLERLRSGVESFTTPQAKNAWLLRQLEFAHTFTFEKQKVLNEEAISRGEWPSCKTGTCYAFDPQKDFHAGQPKLKSSKGPEFMLILQFALAPIAEKWDHLLNTGVGFGQYVWTPHVAESMLGSADKGQVDLMDVVSPENLGALSSMLQAQGIPYGILVEGDVRFERTPLTTWVPCMPIEERIKWSGKMCQATTKQWHAGVFPIHNPRAPQKAPLKDGTSEETKEVDVDELIKYYLGCPGRIFAVRLCTSDDGRPWHHPSCRSLDRRGKGVLQGGLIFEFRDLMSEGHSGIPSYLQMWKGLARKECCGWMWKNSFALWAGCEQSYPKVLRLMTANTGHLNIYERVSRVFDFWYTTCASLSQKIIEETLGSSSSVGAKEVAPDSSNIYWGDFYQPRLFTTLCKSCDISPYPTTDLRDLLPVDRKETVVLKWAGATDADPHLGGSDELKVQSV